MDRTDSITTEVAPQFSLQHLQGWMQQAILPYTTQVAHNTDTPNIAPEYIVRDSQRLTARQHLAIYRQSYIGRLLECMKAQFGALAHALGEELFDMFAGNYLDVHPSGSYTLNDLGEHFAAYLQATRPDADSETKEDWPDFMIELAQFEYALTTIFDRQMPETKYADDKTADDDLKLSPALQLFHHSFPVCNYYLAFSQKQEPELPFPQESFCVVVRKDYKLSLYSLQPAQYLLLKELEKGRNVTHAMHEIAARLGHAEPDLMQAWQQWRTHFIRSGIFVQ